MKRIKSIITVIIIFVSGMIVGGIGGSTATFHSLVNDTFRDGPVNIRRVLVKHAKHELQLDEDQTHQFWQILNETGAELRDAAEPVRPGFRSIIDRAELRLREVLRPDQKGRFDTFMKTARRRWGNPPAGAAVETEQPATASPAVEKP